MEKPDKLMVKNYADVVNRNTRTLWDLVANIKDKVLAKEISHVVEDLDYATTDLNDTLSRL